MAIDMRERRLHSTEEIGYPAAWKGLLAGAVLLLFGASLIPVLGGMGAEAVEAVGWPSAAGRIVSVSVVKENGGRRGLTAGYAPKVGFSYSVSGREYAGDDIGLGVLWSTDIEEVRGWVRPFSDPSQGAFAPAGGPFGPEVETYLPAVAEVPVYYDPKDPSRAILERGTGGSPVISPWFGWMLAVFGAAAIVMTGIRWLQASAARPPAPPRRTPPGALLPPPPRTPGVDREVPTGDVENPDLD